MLGGETVEDLAKRHGLDTMNKDDMRKLHIPAQPNRVKRDTQTSSASQQTTPAEKQKT